MRYSEKFWMYPVINTFPLSSRFTSGFAPWENDQTNISADDERANIEQSGRNDRVCRKCLRFAHSHFLNNVDFLSGRMLLCVKQRHLSQIWTVPCQSILVDVQSLPFHLFQSGYLAFLDIIFVCNCLEQHSNNLSFYGWEANQVIVVTAGGQRKHQLSYSRSFGGRWLLKSQYLWTEWKPSSVNTQLFVCTIVFSFMLGYHVVMRLSFPFVTAATSVASLYSSVDRRLAGVQLFSVSNHLRRERLLRNLVKYVFVLSEQRKTIPEGKYS